ncbi:hypothetical protein DL767_009862 [Monosporascus sp. MG133]|nr:hypothetical protein DL767_009862 [Monosporascus sp. MG133]
MLRRGIQGAEAMEEFERLERAQQQLETELAASVQAVPFADWSLDWDVLNPGASGAVGENSSAGAGLP